MRLIDADALKIDLKDSYERLKKLYDILKVPENRQICAGQLTTFSEAILRVKEAPTIEAEPIKHGRWEEYQTPHIICCSECDWGTIPLEKYKYCPNCGAKMDLEGE